MSANPERRLKRLIGALGAPYGLERSCKIRAGHIERDRCLLSLSIEAFGPAPRAALFELLATLAMPETLWPAARDAAAGATLVHFGSERIDGDAPLSLTKVYFEYPFADQAPALVYRAFKWATEGGGADETHYRQVSACGAAGLAAAIEARFEAGSAVGACMTRALRYPAVQRVADDLTLLDVVDMTSRRASVDLNLYRADLTIGQAFDLLATVGERFAIAARDTDALAASLADKRLGHLAGGMDRTGAPFVTLYYGVEAR